MNVTDLPTPSVLIERRRLDANLKQMQDKASTYGVALRPHTKTHKSVRLARRQLELGARGVTLAKTGEAEVYVNAGIDDVRIAYEIVGTEKYDRLVALMDKARISFCVDTPEGARAASAYFAGAGREAEVLVEVDCGYGRCGVRWDDRNSIDFVRMVGELPGLRLAGILTHAGHAYAGPKNNRETLDDSLRRVARQERDHMLMFARRLHEAGIPGATPNTGDGGRFEISIGSTPSMKYFENIVDNGFTITEIRPGNYVFNDAIQEGLGVVSFEECALSVLATVISKHRNPNGSERVFLDAGRKVFTSDTGYNTKGYGVLLHSARTMVPLPHAVLTALSEEHGWVSVPGGATLDVGNRVRVVPNHACVVVNTQDHLYVVDGEVVIDTLPVDARGRVW